MSRLPAPSPDQPAIRFVEVDGVRLRVSIRGAGRPLLLITGLGAGLDLSEPFEREIVARGLQTISFDAAGMGQSSGYRRPRRMPDVAKTVERMLDALGHDRVDVLGVSLGGIVAQQFAHQAPARAHRLVLAATGPGVVGLGGVPGSPRAWLALATRRRYKSPDYYRRIAGELYGGEARRDPDALLHGRITKFSAAPSLRGYLFQLYALSFWTGLPWLWRLRQPTLVLAGDDDPIVPAMNGRILARCIPDARLHIVRGGGHLFLLERPAELAALVAEFLTAEDDDDLARRPDGGQLRASRLAGGTVSRAKDAVEAAGRAVLGGIRGTRGLLRRVRRGRLDASGRAGPGGEELQSGRSTPPRLRA